MEKDTLYRLFEDGATFVRITYRQDPENPECLLVCTETDAPDKYFKR
jgi:hypothetical protein